MAAEIPTTNPNRNETIDDNALKYTVSSIDGEFLATCGAKSFLLTTDWLEMDKNHEKKLAHKAYADGRADVLLIEKFTDNSGSRTTPPKIKLESEHYTHLLEQSVCRVEKMRHEFDYLQNGTVFSMKYDEFVDSKLRVLEVDAADEAKRRLFSPQDFPYELTNVTGEIEYYGYRVAALV